MEAMNRENRMKQLEEAKNLLIFSGYDAHYVERVRNEKNQAMMTQRESGLGI